MGLDAFVQLGQVTQGVVGGRHRAIAEQPEERRIVGMAADHLLVDEGRDFPGLEANRPLHLAS